MKIAIVGAGIAGLRCGARLAAVGHDVRLFDKGRGPGGRMATRRMTSPALAAYGGEAAFDHGAQYITPKSQAFAAQIAAWEAAGVVAHWPAAGENAFVGAPAMNAPLKAMAAGLDVVWGTEITSLSKAPGGWMMGIEGELFEALVVALPPEQTARLLAPVAEQDISARAATVRSTACWTLMAAFADRVPAVADVLHADGPIGWAARNSAKPGRRSLASGGAEAWVVQASPEWSAAHLEDAAEAVAEALLAALAGRVGAALTPLAITAHRWRYAQSVGTGDGALWLPSQRLGACGDWLLGPRVEAAWLSGDRLAMLIG